MSVCVCVCVCNREMSLTAGGSFSFDQHSSVWYFRNVIVSTTAVLHRITPVHMHAHTLTYTQCVTLL